MNSADSHCRDLVRAGDKDRFLATLFAPEAAQPHLFALYAFNLEVARIRNVVSEPHVGLIRQQWWRDTLEAIYAGSIIGHPVAEALARAIAVGRLPREPLQNLVTAHEFDLYADPMPDMAALETYLGETNSVLIQMAAMLLSPGDAARAAEAAGLAGVAHGLALLLGAPDRRAQFLPPGMDVTGAIAHARKRLAEARALRANLQSSLLPAFLPASLTDLYLRRIEAAPEKPLAVTQFRRQITLWYHAGREKF